MTDFGRDFYVSPFYLCVSNGVSEKSGAPVLYLKMKGENIMTNLEKFKEVFGDTGTDVKASPSWLGKEYNGPVKKTEMDKFIDWLITIPYVRYEVKDADLHSPVGSSDKAIYIYDLDKNPIIRVSDFNSVTESAYVRYEGLAGDMPVSKIKEIISKAASKCDPFANIFNDIWKH